MHFSIGCSLNPLQFRLTIHLKGLQIFLQFSLKEAGGGINHLASIQEGEQTFLEQATKIDKQ